jgi:PKD repeat protein
MRPGSEVVLLGANGNFATMGNPNRGDRAPFSCTEADGTPVRDCLPVDGPSHTVDGLAFGPDGALYVSTGDATLQPEVNIRAQDINSLAGKILRIHPLTGQGYADNPFFDGDPASNRSKVYALGLRNPFRFTFEPGSGAVVVGDVGGEQWEEINRGGPGANFGWPCYEGPDRFSNQPVCAALFNGAQPVTFALHSYPHAGLSGAAIGGDFYTGGNFPAPYRDAYFFADHNRAALLYLTRADAGAVTAHKFAENAIAPVQLSAGADGALYLLSFVDGSLVRIRYAGGENRPPLASAAAAPTAGSPPLTVVFSSQGSVDPDGEPLTYRWQFGDGGESDQANPQHTYARPGQYVAQLAVTDAAGGTATSAVTIAVGEDAPVVRILAPADESSWPIGRQIELRGEATDPQGNPLPGERLRWTAILHHNEHLHPDYFNATGTTAQFVFEPHGENSYLELCLAATTAAGVAGQACVNLRPGGASLPPTAVADVPAAPVGAGAGRILRERWTGIGGATVADLTGHPRYPGQPDEVDFLNSLDSAGLGTDYGERLRGWLHPPVTGDYFFWIASDDSSELWLSPDADPANARAIAAVATWTSRQNWTQTPGQASGPISLRAGERYYLEVRHKQADQKDNLSVAWQIPGGTRAVIDGAYLSPVVE